MSADVRPSAAPGAAPRTTWVLSVACGLLLAGCGGDGPAAPTPTPSPTPSAASSPSPSPTAAADPRCTHPTDGYSVAYPAEWFVADGERIEPCSFFHPEPLDLEPATEADGVAIRLDVLPDAFPEARRKVQADGATQAQEDSISGRVAMRFVGETTGEGLLPAGLATTTWLVDLGDRTLLLTTDEGGRDDYAAAVEVLDEMARSVQVP